jgi:DNA-binding response OmpR family regulator
MTDGRRDQLRILIVEDEPLLAFDVQDGLSQSGFDQTSIVFSVQMALNYIEKEKIDAAIVDANLLGMSAEPVGALLAKRGVPFVVVSGYAPGQLAQSLRGVPFLAKPISMSALVKVLSGLLTSAVAERRDPEIHRSEPVK